MFITGRAEDKRSKFTGEGNCDSKAEAQFEQQRRRSEGKQHLKRHIGHEYKHDKRM